MERRNVGGFDVSVLGLGTSRLASMGSGRSKSDAKTLLAAARDCGITLIDTADTYGSTASERWIGELTQADRDDWVVVTKTGLPTVDLPGPLRALNQPAKKLKQARNGGSFELDRTSLMRRIERSLQRLRRERIEIFLLHLPPATIVDDEQLRDILQEAQREGKIAQFGVSTDELPTIDAIGRTWGCTVAETAVNRWNGVQGVAGVARDMDIIANHAMGSPAQRRELLARESASSTPHPASPLGRRLLRHAAAVPGVKVVLTGTSDPAHLRENARAFDTPVSADDLGA
ncbi:aldo/keto reductase [Microbacterium sp. NPDC056044]|uniref:aldo/keto reductase n=1 Tax=Microbacterium sp. NPDC056044 TaxID=3345690 RepID=UPI0035D91BED